MPKNPIGVSDFLGPGPYFLLKIGPKGALHLDLIFRANQWEDLPIPTGNLVLGLPLLNLIQEPGWNSYQEICMELL